MKTIYSYLNYRDFLRDIIDKMKDENPAFSHRMILSKIGVSSSGFFCNVISGRCNLTVNQIEKLSDIFNLSASEKHYFKLLLYFSKAKSVSEKNDFYGQLIKYRKQKHKSLANEELTLFSKWYYPVIREIINYTDFVDDFSWLARQVSPPLRVHEAKKAIKTLCELELIKQDSDDFYRQQDAVLSTGNEVKSLHVVNYQMSMIDLAKKAIEKVKPKERDISGVTLSISNEKFQLLKLEYQNFRKKIIQIATNDTLKADRVVRCNLQLFPLSKRNK